MATRIHNKTQRSAAKEREVREKFQSTRPSLDDLVASGDYAPPVSQGGYWDLMTAIAQLRAERRRARISLTDLSKRTGMDRAAISRLENGVHDNPTIETLNRYARGLGKQIVVKVMDAPPGGPATRTNPTKSGRARSTRTGTR